MNLAPTQTNPTLSNSLNPLVRHANRFRQETEAALREMVFVLKMTQRVKKTLRRKRVTALALVD